MIANKSLFSWVFERYRGLQFLLFLLIVATIFFRVFPLEMQKRIVNSAIALKRIDALLIYCGLYLAAVVLAGLLKYVINVLQGYIGQKILLEMRSRLYEHILRLPLSFFRSTSPGLVIASLTSELSVIGEFMGGAVAVPVINILTLVTFAGYMAYLNPLLALLSFAVYPVELLIIPMLQRRFNLLNQKRIHVTRSLSGTIGEAITGMHEIHGNASYHLEGRKLMHHAAGLFSLRHQMNVLKFLIKFANNFFQSLGPFILFLVGGYLTIHGRLDLGALVAFLSAYEKLYDPWKELMDYYQDLQDSRVRYKQIIDHFDRVPEFALAPEEGRAPYALKGAIDIKDLSYVAEEQIRILDQISLELSSGTQLAVVGFSGSGKSTLAMIMGQLTSYSGGHVLIDGFELKGLTKFDASHNIGYVPQYPFIFEGSLRENLLYACASLCPPGGERALPTGRELLGVIERVGLADDILNIGLNAMLSRDSGQEFAQRLIGARKVFFERWGVELSDAVDFFDANRFQYHTSIGANITFGTPNRPEYALERLPANPLFRDFLMQSGLFAPLLHFGEEIARETVSLLQGLEQEAFFFEMSPIPLDEFDQYSRIVDELTSGGRRELAPEGREALIRLALRFVPARHKMAAFPLLLEVQVLHARQRFMEEILSKDPEGFTFYRPTEYLYSQNVLSNVLFGYARQDQPQAMERVRRRVVELIKEEGLMDDLMGVALEFNVGSKGDRLSGGQKQKIAIARALLKRPKILILDEATASLDNTSQARIQQLLNAELKGACTVISVVHRLELVRDYDMIAVMKGGKIVEMGNYDELMDRGGLFYELAHGN